MDSTVVKRIGAFSYAEESCTLFECFIAQTLNILQLLPGLESSLSVAVVDNLLGQRGTNAADVA